MNPEIGKYKKNKDEPTIRRTVEAIVSELVITSYSIELEVIKRTRVFRNVLKILE